MGNTLLLKGKGIFFTDDVPYGSRVFATLPEATAYATSHPLAYVGQLLIVTSMTSGRLYVVNTDRTLMEIGGNGIGGVTSVNSRTGAITLNKSDVELSNVDNTSDLSKPLSLAQQTAIQAILTTNIPLAPAATPAAGIAITAARADHIHPLPNVSLIPYGNTTVGAVLEQLTYLEPTASLSGGGTREVGETVTSVSLTWNYNKEIVSQSLNQGIGDLIPTLRSYTHSEQSITSNRTYTITANDGKKNVTANTTIAFNYRRYWGVSANPTLADAEILAMSSEFSSSRSQTRTFNCSGGRYFYLVWPASWGTGSFNVGGLAFSDLHQVTRDMVNSAGATVPVLITRCNILQNGTAIQVTVG